jgi:hypothetical protein
MGNPHTETGNHALSNPQTAWQSEAQRNPVPQMGLNQNTQHDTDWHAANSSAS